jgi:hypothetical protein
MESSSIAFHLSILKLFKVHIQSDAQNPGVATSILKHSMMKIKQGKLLALAHFKTK